MSEKRRNYRYLKTNLSHADFKSLCKRVANQYANSEQYFSYSYFCKNENITKACFYRVIEEAIVKNWISEDAVNKAEAKSVANQKIYTQNTTTRTFERYARLRKKRNDYIISTYTNAEIEAMAKDFAKSTEISKREFAEKNGISVVVVDEILRKAFVENIADDETCKAIEKRSLKKDSSERTKNFFKQIWNQRKDSK